MRAGKEAIPELALEEWGKSQPGQEEGVLTERKFVCRTHSEAKQTEMPEFGAEKGLLQGHARRQVAPAPKSPQFSKGFGKAFLKAR